MDKIIMSVLGEDRPGIIAAITRILYQQNCRIENVSQVVLQSKFSGIFIICMPGDLSVDSLNLQIKLGLSEMNVQVHIKKFNPLENQYKFPVQTIPFVITAWGHNDQDGQVSGITEVIAQHGVNINKFKAMLQAGPNELENIMIFEVDIPVNIDFSLFKTLLLERAECLDLSLSIQHAQVIHAIHSL